MRKTLLTVLLACAAGATAAAEVNQAKASDLDGLKGIGPKTSQRILDERQKSPFKDWKDFMKRVKGVGPGAAAKLSAQGLTVNGARYTATK